MKRHIDYIGAGNDWIMIQFANSEDMRPVFELRPWHVNGLNFVIHKWTPFFDSYSAILAHIDQWVRVPKLPWEFWDIYSLIVLLKSVGLVVRVDQNTLLCLKGKFARVCLNIDITHPLLGSLAIAKGTSSMRAPLIYEGLHEVCPLCGGKAH